MTFRSHMNYLYRIISVKEILFFSLHTVTFLIQRKSEAQNMERQSCVWTNGTIFTFDQTILGERTLHINTYRNENALL